MNLTIDPDDLARFEEDAACAAACRVLDAASISDRNIERIAARVAEILRTPPTTTPNSNQEE